MVFFLLGLCCEFIDSHLGGGYGTILTPVFLIMGYSPLQIIPCILITEIFTGFISGGIYHKFGYVASKSSIVIFITASVGAILGSSLLISISKFYVSLYIGILVIILGIMMLMNYKIKYSIKSTGLLGVLLGFNKALTGGGFGPVAVAGLSIFGLDSKKAIGTTLLAEGLVCSTALILLLFRNVQILLDILLPLLLGAIIGGVIGSIRAVKYESKAKLQMLVSIFIIILGCFILFKLL